VGHASGSSGVFRVESRARISQSDLKTSGGTMTGGERGSIAEVVSCGS
jgi:hypothetical protein